MTLRLLRAAVVFVHETIRIMNYVLLASKDLQELMGPTSFYDRWLRWQSQSKSQETYQHIADELTKALQAEPVSWNIEIL